MNNKKPTLIKPSTASTRAVTTFGTLRLKAVTALPQKPKINAHSKREPSWLPQTAEIKYCVGRLVLELFTTLATEKSCVR